MIPPRSFVRPSSRAAFEATPLIGRALASVLVGVVSFALATVAAFLFVALVVLAAGGVGFILLAFQSPWPWPLRVAFGLLNTVVPPTGGLLVLLGSAVRLTGWRRISPWPAVAVAGLLAGVTVYRLFNYTDDLNCFLFGVSLAGGEISECDIGIR